MCIGQQGEAREIEENFLPDCHCILQLLCAISKNLIIHGTIIDNKRLKDDLSISGFQDTMQSLSCSASLTVIERG